jgi:hypothetical protein
MVGEGGTGLCGLRLQSEVSWGCSKSSVSSLAVEDSMGEERQSTWGDDEQPIADAKDDEEAHLEHDGSVFMCILRQYTLIRHKDASAIRQQDTMEGNSQMPQRLVLRAARGRLRQIVGLRQSCGGGVQQSKVAAQITRRAFIWACTAFTN